MQEKLSPKTIEPDRLKDAWDETLISRSVKRLMLDTYPSSFKHVLTSEGGYTNNPNDRGGPTNLGVTQNVYNGWRRLNGLVAQSVRYIGTSEAQAIYRQLYWSKVDGDLLPIGIDYAVFDYAVNSGPGAAAKAVQKVLLQLNPKEAIKVDGVIGPATLAALHDVDPSVFIKAFCLYRMSFLRRLWNWFTFGKGWTARINGRWNGGKLVEPGVLQVALSMLTMEPPQQAAA